MSINWQEFWDNKASAANDFQATGRGLMDTTGFLHTVAEVVRLLNLKQGQTLADIGCGSGLIALSLAPWLSHIYGVDISSALIARAQGNLAEVSNVNLQTGSLTDIPLKDACVDKLLAYSVVQYLGDEEAVSLAFKQVERVLKKGGRALLAANPDPARRLVYEDILRNREDKLAAEKEIALLDDLLWVQQKKIVQLAAETGLSASIKPISSRIWQHFYMFDVVVDKSS
jgi:ubiquinone/menaquinone biosynthesis C-methylase UbiE